MISVSFYLLPPEAITQSLVYVSISNKEKRLRFSTGTSFIVKYCNIRKKKGTKSLVKRNTTLFFDYDSHIDLIEGIDFHILIYYIHNNDINWQLLSKLAFNL